MNRKRMSIIGLTLSAVLSVCACAKEEQQVTFTGSTAQEPEYQSNLNVISPSAYGEADGLKLEPGTYISIIGKAEEPAYWRAVEAGVMQAADDLNAALGYTGNDKIKVTYNGPARVEDIDEQVNILDEELSRYPDVIGIASVDEEACTVQFDLATENGIPIIALDSGNQYQGIQCTVKTDNKEAVRTGAHRLAEEIGGKGEVILLVHDSKSESAKERAEGFQNAIAEEYPDIRIAEVLYCDDLEEIKKEIAEEENPDLKEEERKIIAEGFSDADALQYVMERHPELRGVFGTSEQATQLGLEAIKQVERDAENIEKNPNTSGQEEIQAPDAGTEEKNSDVQKETDTEKESEADMEAEAGRKESEGKSFQDSNSAEKYSPIILMGFDAGEKQMQALEKGEISGLVVQNPFGIGYASVIAAARTVLEAGNEAQVTTGYIWVTKENMEDELIQKMLYK